MIKRQLIDYLYWLPLVALASALSGALAGALTSPVAMAAAQTPQKVYGDTATYIVKRDNTPAGTHRLTFTDEGDRLIVTSATRATMRFFKLFDIPFIYDSRAVWHGDVVLTLSASFGKGEQNKQFELAKNGNSYQLQNGSTYPAPLFPTNHWHADAIRQPVLFNTLNGKIAKVAIRAAGTEMLDIGGQAVSAQRYEVSGDLVVSLWYGMDGKWLQLAFSKFGSDYLFTYQPDNITAANGADTATETTEATDARQ